MMEANLTALELLEEEAVQMGIIIDYKLLRDEDEADGLYVDIGENRAKVIALNRYRSQAEQFAALAEEMGHHFASCGNIIKQDTITSRKQEMAGRRWAIRKILPLEKLEIIRHLGIYAFAEEMGVPIDFIQEAMRYYNSQGEVL